MKTTRTVLIVLGVLLVLGVVLNTAFRWTGERVFVGPDQALMVINKFGDPLPADRIVVPRDDNRYQGVQEDLLGPGRYFLNPVTHDYKVVPLTEIPAGDPSKWQWDDDGNIKDPATLPRVGVVSLKQGKAAPPGMDVVDAGYKGIQKAVLTPGTYKINPQQYEVTLANAVVVPPGSVGVVTRLVGDAGPVDQAPIATVADAMSTTGPTTGPAEVSLASRLAVGPTQRGILRDVLQPGIYYLNPRTVKVTFVSVGYSAISMDAATGTGITFYTSDGYQVEADFTVVWGRSPADAPNIVARIGGVEGVRQNVIEPAMKAACQNEGGRYSAKQLIQGATRIAFQDALSASLEQQVRARNLHILLALIRNIAIKDVRGDDATGGLLATIQQADIEKERDLTNRQRTATAAVQAQLDQALKLVDVARETVTSDSRVKVANLAAEGAKRAAEITAQREVDVATIDLEVAKLDAQRTTILGKAAGRRDADAGRRRGGREQAAGRRLRHARGVRPLHVRQGVRPRPTCG